MTLDLRDNPPPALLERFRDCCWNHSDINEHLGILYGLARQCESVTEFGVRDGNSTTALLAAQPWMLLLYDVNYCPVVNNLQLMRGQTNLFFWQEDSRTADIDPTDMLHIDTLHNYACLSIELQRHAPKVDKWIAMHDTATWGERGDDGGEGLNKAIAELVAGGKWREFARFSHCHGMTILQRIADE